MAGAYRVRRGVAAALVLLACDRTEKAPRGPPPAPSMASVVASAASPAASEVAAPSALPSGAALIERFECGRCHIGLGTAPPEKECVGCHDRIFHDHFGADPAVVHRWKKNIRHLKRVPVLVNLGARFRPEWLTEFLVEPRDLRPHLEETMPRFAMSRDEATQIAAWLTSDARDAPAEPASAPASWQRGRDVYQEKRCAQCHGFTGIVPGERPSAARDETFETARRLSPDLRFARDRMTRTAIVRWLRDTGPVWPIRLMPAVTLSADEIAALAAFILESPLEPVAPAPAPPRLPLLTRAVTYDEVEREVFHRTCWHCHAEPNYARGDGGPGNTGGFGFAGVRLSFLGYETVLAGYRNKKGEAMSLFRKNAEGVPRLVESLLARQDEERGHPRAGVRGMPLGLPSLRPEQIQLVETWIAQGRRP